jgi:hypothetical protein
MDTKIDTGGPAFPHPAGWRRDPEISDGMTWLDFAAIEAMRGLLSDRENHVEPRAVLADDAYDIASALLAEKRRREGGA